MKFQNFLTFFALCAITFFSACKNEGDAARDAAVDTAGGAAVPDVSAIPGTTPPATSEPPQNAEGVWHYTCPKGCEGGAGSALPCPKCGTTLAHNTAYHPAPGSPSTTITPTATNPATPAPTTPPAQTPEPPQNASGVWHYTCPKGCAGGAGSAVACGKCGATLAHNTAYHK